MALLIVGLIVFFAAHSFTTLREARAGLVARLGEGPYKIAHSLVSLAGLVLIIWGFGTYRAEGYIPLWDPPIGLRHAATLLLLPAMVLLAAAYAPAGLIKGVTQHPMLTGVKLWAFAHLLANGDLGSVILFGTFLAWAAYDRIAVKRREGGTVRVRTGWNRGDWIAVGLGAFAWIAFIGGLHRWLFGVGVFA